jgi:hypothetical protein
MKPCEVGEVCAVPVLVTGATTTPVARPEWFLEPSLQLSLAISLVITPNQTTSVKEASSERSARWRRRCSDGGACTVVHKRHYGTNHVHQPHRAP